MKQYIKEFLHRGLLFGGFGPIIVSVVYWILEKNVADFSLSGSQVLCAIVSTYLLAFVQAGASLFNQIEHWPTTKCLFFHFGTLYVAYILCYIFNTWIPFEISVLLIFTAIFVVVYFVVWFTVYIIIRITSHQLNQKLAQK